MRHFLLVIYFLAIGCGQSSHQSAEAINHNTEVSSVLLQHIGIDRSRKDILVKCDDSSYRVTRNIEAADTLSTTKTESEKRKQNDICEQLRKITEMPDEIGPIYSSNSVYIISIKYKDGTNHIYRMYNLKAINKKTIYNQYKSLFIQTWNSVVKNATNNYDDDAIEH